MLPEPGVLFDRYKIEAVLGEGGMGRVYRAFDERLHRRIALKILHAQDRKLGDSLATDGAARLLREARLAAALDHPNAVGIFDVGEARLEGETAPMPYIAMELIEGRNVRAYVGVSEVGLAERIRWLTDVARALAAAHRRNLIHRDVKPENVMIRDDGVVKVLDFGIARRKTGSVDPAAATQAAAMGTLTADGVVVGTPFYMAPEQMRGEPLDGRADQFSWAVVAYELLSGELPWDRTGDPLKVVSQVLSFDPPSLRTKDLKIPAPVEAIVARALSKSAANRFASMDEVVSSLDALGLRPTVPPTAVSAIEILGSAPTIQSTRTSLATGSGSSSPQATTAPSPKAGGARPTTLWAVLAAIAVLGGATAVGVARHGARPPSPLDAGPAPGPTAITDLPPPKTTPEALAAYEDGIRAIRRGEVSDIVHSLQHAIALDAKLAPALLRLGYGLLLHRATVAREYFRKAMELKGTMSIRDQGLLEAFIPFVESSPPDLAGTRTRLAALAARYPLDAEIAFELASADRRLSRCDDALPEYDRAFALDPGFAYAETGKATCLLTKGDRDGAIAAAKACGEAAPGAMSCFRPKLEVENEDGRCAAMEEDARQIVLSHPDAIDGYVASAQALYATGGAMTAVKESLAQAHSRMPERTALWKAMQLLDVNVEVLQGDFVSAEKLELAREADPSVTSNSDEGSHSLGAWARIELATESGSPKKAADIAAEHVARSQAWTKNVRVLDEPQFEFGTMIDSVLAHAKRMPVEQYESNRSKLIAATDTKAEPLAGAYLWYAVYARPVTTDDEAKAALALLPKYEPLPMIQAFPADLAIGEVYRRTGHLDEAIPRLKRAANACDALVYPFDNTRAHFALGEALEAKADTAGACAAYAVVMSRWGHAKPRSVTADAARARMQSLRCAQ